MRPYSIKITTDDVVWQLATAQVRAIGYISLWSLPREKRDQYLLYAFTNYYIQR